MARRSRLTGRISGLALARSRYLQRAGKFPPRPARMVRVEPAQRTPCAECERSFGPHYRGTCGH